MESMKELSLSDLEGISGGIGGYFGYPPRKKGFRIYQIKRGDTLRKIALRFGTSEDYLLSINPSINNSNFLTPDYYIYVPE